MKILMATMSLDIGGAETHIVELSRELTRRGHAVTVVSRGGMYVKELERSGVRHVCLPLNTKHISAVIRSLHGLRRLIAQEQFDIVHAHARIPAFLCGILASRMHFRFVTSAHGVFKVTPYWRLISNWGRQTLAVSCDIKQYLIENYGICADNITLTVNGIDTQRFAPHPERRADIERSLELRPGSPRLLYVSRIDREAAHVGFYLCEALPELEKAVPGLEVVVVGGGTAWDELKQDADALNARLGRRALVLTGPRTDIPDLLQIADGYIGVSRAALEAMACGLPVILSGSQGRIGLFDDTQLVPALDTNFCCRGLPLPNRDNVADDVRALFALPSERRAEMGRYNRQVVEKNYSIARMADDAESVYRKMCTHSAARRTDILLSGYYGFGNTGDDSLLAVITEQLRRIRPELGITVLSQNPRATAAIFDVRSINRFSLPALLRESRSARLLINGSGNLMQNSTSLRSLIYYAAVMRLCRKRGCRVMLYASGIGPLYGRRAHQIARRALEETDLITLRDEQSAQLLRELGVEGADTRQSADPACLIEPADPAWISYLRTREGLKEGERCFAVALRPWSDTVAGYENEIRTAVENIRKKHVLTPVFISMQRSKDDAICRRLAEHFGAPVLSGLTASELTGLLSGMEFVIGMRLHTLIYAADAGVPFIGLAYDLKINALTEQFGMQRFNLDVRSVRAEELCATADALLAQRDVLCAQIRGVHDAMRTLALRDTQAAVELLDQNQNG